MPRAGVPVWLIAALLALMTGALYWPVTGYDFITLDDPAFVTSNTHVQGGFKWEAVKWTFQLNQGDYWHPLTWLSLMLDVSLFGRGAGGFHFTNLALHAANTAFLFLLLWWLTGAFWRSVAVAALFALHPLRVESVAWVTERKDVLSGFFGLLALISYGCYAGKAKVRNQSTVISNQSSEVFAKGKRSRTKDHRSLCYLLSLFFFACGLMSKAMLVTWPFVMLLLDYWPLRRLEPSTLNSQPSTILRLVREKIPFFLLSGISCALTYLTETRTQQAVGSLVSPLLFRLETALVAYALYLGKTFWPIKLAVPYVTPGHWSWFGVGGSLMVVAGACLMVFRLGRRWPYLVMGWCWFMGTLVPVLGLTQGWGTFIADRFTYTPSIGLLILVVWGVCELTQRWEHQALGLWVAGGAAVILYLALTRQQLGYWRDTESLFRHTLAVTDNNEVAHNSLGIALGTKGQTDEAIRQFQEALRLKPAYADAHYNLGVALDKRGLMDEASRQFREALRLRPDYPEAHYNLGSVLAKIGQTDEAIRQYQEAIRLQPDYAVAHHNLGNALFRKGQVDEAILQYHEVLRLQPDDTDTHYNLGVAFFQRGRTREAIRQFQAVLRLNPDHAEARNNLTRALRVNNAPPGR